jgi:hypothetical protein
VSIIGGGKFIGANGKMQNLPYIGTHIPPSSISLPDDVLPSELELERNLEAITISHGNHMCNFLQNRPF